MLGNSSAGAVGATTYPSEDGEILAAEAAYSGMEAELQNYLDTYTATHSYDEYHFDLDVYKRQVVADICAGSATTAVAALNTGRRFICFETVPAYYAAATERIRLARSALEAGEKGV